MSPILMLGFIAVMLFYVVVTYNQFQTLKTRLKAAIQEIGNQLKRQAELIPNLTQAAKGYLKHEKNIFQALTEARKAVTQAVESGKTEKMLEAQELVQKALSSMRIILESNPQLQAAGVVTGLMNELRDTADKVMYARRTLIDLTADYNRMVVTIPSNLIAKIFGFKEERGLKFLEKGTALTVKAEETKTPKVNLDA